MTQDFKYALRSLSRNPLFALGAIAALSRPVPGRAAHLDPIAALRTE